MNTITGLTPSQVSATEIAQWKQAIRQELADVRCATPAFLVKDIDPVAQTVTVQVAIQERTRPAQGAAQWWDIPPIYNVPVVLPRGGGFSITLPLKVGDEGLLVFCDTCFDNWWLNGQNAAPPAVNVSTPSGSQRQFEVRRHYVHDCGFIPGMWSQPNVLTSYATSSMQLRSDDGATIIDLSETGVSVNGAAVTASNGGVARALMNDVFYQWYVTNIQPFLVGLGYVGPVVPAGSETSILKGE